MTELALDRRAASDRLRAYGPLVGWWAAGRALVLTAAAALHVLGPRVLVGRDERAHVFGVLAAWDGRWYRIVAEHGYLLEPGRQSDPAFFPLYPLLLRGVHAFGLGYAAAGIALANLALLGALFAFEALTRELFDARFARRAATYLALFPVGIVFSMSYPESVILLALALAALAALRERWGLAAFLAAAAALGRPEAALVALPLLALALRARRRRGLALGAAVAPAAALGSFALYLGVRLHDPLAWTRAERAWGRHFTPTGFVGAFTGLPRAFEGNAWIVRDVVFLVVYLTLLAVAARTGTPRSWVAAGVVVVVLPLFSGAFTSISRFGLLAPAVFWGLAALGSRPRVDRAIRTVSFLLLGCAAFSLPYVFP